MKYGLEFSGARRVRRGWGWTLLTALTWLTLAALAGWLLHVLRSAAQGTVRTTMGPLPLAMAATGGGMSRVVATWLAWGVLTLCLVGIGAWTWRRVMEWHAVGEFVDELQRASAGEEFPDRLKPGRRTGRVMPTSFPPPPPKCSVGEPAKAGTTNGERLPDVRRIVETARQECRDARQLLESARHTLSVEDYEEALAGASRRLHQVIWSLANLGDELGTGNHGLAPAATSRVGPLESLSLVQEVEVLTQHFRGWGTAWDVDEFWEALARDERAAATEPAEAGTTNKKGGSA